MNAMGGKFWFSVLMSWFVLVEGARVGATVWLSVWTDNVDVPGGSGRGPFWYLGIYTAISAVQVGCVRNLSAYCWELKPRKAFLGIHTAISAVQVPPASAGSTCMRNHVGAGSLMYVE